MRVIFEIKILLVSMKKDLCQCQPPCTMQVSSYNICIIYLQDIVASLKFMIAVFFFFQIRKIFRNHFNREMGNIRSSKVVQQQKGCQN